MVQKPYKSSNLQYFLVFQGPHQFLIQSIIDLLRFSKTIKLKSKSNINNYMLMQPIFFVLDFRNIFNIKIYKNIP